MKLIRHKSFTKNYAKLSKKLQAKTDETLLKFALDPFDPRLKNHPLKGSMFGKRAISVTGDVRIIFEEYDDYVLVVMLDVGSHPQVYGV